MRVVDHTGVIRTIKRIRAIDAGGVIRTLKRVRAVDAGGVIRSVFQYLTVAVAPTEALGFDSGAASSGNVTTNGVTATVTGGTAPFTYLWQRVSGSFIPTVSSAAAATVSFDGVVSEAGAEAMFTVTVTDSTSAQVTSEPIVVQLNWIDTR